MPRLIDLLNPGQLATLPEGEHCDGSGLYLCVTGHGGRSWIVKYQFGQGKDRKTEKMGLGALADVSLKVARAEARKVREKARNGVNPKLERQQVSAPARSGPTFLEYATAFTTEHVKQLKNAKSVEKWWRSVNTYCAALHTKRLNEITLKDVIGVLATRWLSHPQAMKDCRQHLQAILGAAKVQEHRSGDNPASWDNNLEHIPPFKNSGKGGKKKKNHPSMPYKQLPAFMAELRQKQTVSAWCLEVLILTGVRTTEALQMQWDQIDMVNRRWVIPGKAMKNDMEADIPLTDTVVARLDAVKELGLDSKYVFPGMKPGAMMSNNTMLKLLQQDLGRENCTVHGFRSSFRTWGQDETEHSHEALEFCLHHITGDAAAKAYKNGKMWAKRLAAFQDWEAFCKTPKPAAPAEPEAPAASHLRLVSAA